MGQYGGGPNNPYFKYIYGKRGMRKPIPPPLTATGQDMRELYRRMQQQAESKQGQTSSAPDLVEPILAWRVWSIVKSNFHGFLLQSLNGVKWVPREPLVAECGAMGARYTPYGDDPNHGPAPRDDCTCGIYAATGSQLHSYMRSNVLIGEVALWGRVRVAKQGYRAQYAYPTRIFLPEKLAPEEAMLPFMGQLSETYGVPVSRAVFDDLMGMVNEAHLQRPTIL